MEFTSPEAEQRYADLRSVLPRAIVGLDFDGTLSPIVDDPAQARIHPDAREVLVELADQVAAVAVITGRPARQALALGDLDEVGREVGDRGRELHVIGQYGNERWSSVNRRIISPRPPAGLAHFLGALPGALRRAGAEDAFVEEKGLAVAVHTRRLPEPTAAYERLVPELRALAEQHGLMLEPGRQVIEVRPPGTDKGAVVRMLVEELDAEGVLFAGDDLGDVEAFQAVSDLRDEGLVGLLVCSQSEEQTRLVELADIVVPGPEGVLELLRSLTD
ncbi:MAG TPA: trehalose-phosphatase [Nocardioides sp.]|nr:trehalose-phosphatase [Nocardioides sp.]